MHPTTPVPARARTPRRRALLVATGAIAGLVAPVLGPARPAAAAPPIVPSTSRATHTRDTAPDPTEVDRQVLVDASGRYVFFSTRGKLQADDTNGAWDVYRRDQLTSRVTRISLTDADGQIGGDSHLCGTSPQGDVVGFWSSGTGLPNGPGVQLFVRDLAAGATERVSVSNVGIPSGTGSVSGLDTAQPCGVSSHGAFVAFASVASNLVSTDPNGVGDVFRRDRSASTTALVSQDPLGFPANGVSWWPSISDDGSRVAFQSNASNLVGFGNDANVASDVFVRDLALAITSLASATPGGGSAGAPSSRPSLAGNGSAVAFESLATDLVADDDNGKRDVFVATVGAAATERVSVASNGNEADGGSSFPSISRTGRYVGFSSVATNLYAFDGGAGADAFRHDRELDRTDLVSRTNGVVPGTGASDGGATISQDGNVAAFSSNAEDLVRNDDNDDSDAFTRTFALDLEPFASVDGAIARIYADSYGGTAPPQFLDLVRPGIVHGEVSLDQLLVGGSRDEGSAELRAKVIRLYWAFFERQPDLGGLGYWTGRLVAGKKLATAATQFSTSSEFKNTYGPLSNSAFVTLIYQNIFDRDPDASGLAYWTKKLDTKAKAKGEVMLAFSESSEGVRLLQPVVDAVLLPLLMLGHPLTTAEFEGSLSAMLGGEPPELLARNLRHTAAYAARVSS